MPDSFAFWFSIGAVVEALLLGWLWIMVGRRHRGGWPAQQRELEKAWSGTAFPVSSVLPQIRQLREDYLTALHSRPGSGAHRLEFIVAARRAIAAFPYFRPPEKPDPENAGTGQAPEQTGASQFGRGSRPIPPSGDLSPCSAAVPTAG